MQKKNRREFERFEVDFPVQTQQAEKGAIGCLRCVDISASGMGLFTQEPLIPNLHVETWVKIPDGHQPLHNFARVVWSKQVDENRWRAGVKLEDINLMRMRRLLPNSLEIAEKFPYRRHCDQRERSNLKNGIASALRASQ